VEDRVASAQVYHGVCFGMTSHIIYCQQGSLRNHSKYSVRVRGGSLLPTAATNALYVSFSLSSPRSYYR